LSLRLPMVAGLKLLGGAWKRVKRVEKVEREWRWGAVLSGE